MRLSPVRRAPRTLVAAALVATCVVSVSGCAVLDGRSPFDTSNVSYADVDRALPAVQDALDEADLPVEVSLYTGSSNCEGACDLGVGVNLVPADDAQRPELDPDVLAAVLVVVLPEVPGMPLYVRGDPADDVGLDLEPATRALGLDESPFMLSLGELRIPKDELGTALDRATARLGR
ncbi:hypothetical protein ACWFQT_13330 [Cellulosimicrobium cellulans]|uniref:Uncharacterized protein n=1 Tax=Cellulosimicrobium cellulans F16 TaxID=1350482 RepID=A0A0M0F2B6_CELCE|nr:hypothetical protein [Cellulosimicrobium cellulans]KON71725.1 hypothetical protein M768_17225 [Cellulosimicrobium cellulans F16]